MKTRISNSLTIGGILGVVALGYTSDMFSRKTGLLFTSSLVAIGTLMSAVALQIHLRQNMLWYFVLARGSAGFGEGGEYPPSAAAGIEESDDVVFLPISARIIPSRISGTEEVSWSSFCFFYHTDGHHCRSNLADYLPDLPGCRR